MGLEIPIFKKREYTVKKIIEKGKSNLIMYRAIVRRA
jgi:hypothetical protein